ncbi:D-sedoheptulose-7-phosphate isomerase [Rathayibacter rathayi]|uniref:D-sedoheptulose-7-phosphate isomerase n=1 Tax=Rathayibacter rathayi TaxID=33887 RepID=UPI000CE7A593|nr:SIS domain-containing protein [Rathayibacter rathayi]PPG69923.1 phosphoheptose isomerase [Rathayibacter rathayi]PPG76214.1 phosphoheptose isomerase [Rathayibacter rathayi]PPI77417.1 phosphoheptose isomerase [Rathayibacter rathayi]
MTIDTATIDTVLDTPTDAVRRHVDDHVARARDAVAQLQHHSERIAAWGVELADRLHAGARLLAAGNGGSAAEAQHLTAELVGRFDGDRIPFSALSLHAETSSLTAIGNDYGFDHVFARQVTAHARAGDVVVLLSTSGRSANLLHAAEAARAAGARSWALTGEGPNPLTELCDEAIALEGHGANVQEAQLVLVHALCRAFEHRIRARTAAAS